MTTRIQVTIQPNESARIIREPEPRKSQFQIIEEIAKSREGKTRWR
jgi:hypothetical protein